MTHPEVPADGVVPDSILMPDLIRELVEIERFERIQAYDALYAAIGRVELLGVDDASRESFHHHYTEDGERSVSFEANNRKGLGRFFHVMVNDVVIDNSDGLCLSIREFVVTHKPRYIVRNETSLRRSQREHQWQYTHETGPILTRRHDRVDVYRGKRSRMPLPDMSTRPDYTDVLDRRLHALELFDILKPLNTVTLEPDILLTDPE